MNSKSNSLTRKQKAFETVLFFHPFKTLQQTVSIFPFLFLVASDFLHVLQQPSPNHHPSMHPFPVHVAETVWGILSIIVLYLASLQSQKPPEFDPVPQHHRGRKGWLKKAGWMMLLSC